MSFMNTRNGPTVSAIFPITLKMKQHMQTKAILLLSIISLLLFSCENQEAPSASPPNILFVMMDDYGYGQLAAHSRELAVEDFDPLFVADVAEHNDYAPEEALSMSQLATPTLTRLADDGVLFYNAFTSSNLCAASRLGVATGILQNRWGVYRNIDAERHGPKPGTHLAEKLQQAGYATAHIGKWHIGTRDQQLVAEKLRENDLPDTLSYYQVRQAHPEVGEAIKNSGYEGSVIDAHHPLNNGFDYYFGYNTWESPFYNATNVWENHEYAGPVEEYNTDVFTAKAADFIKESMEAGKPFYVQLHMHAVHAPLAPKAPDEYLDRFQSESFILNNFYAHVFAVDESVRKLEELLREKGQAENTIIVFTSDNGGSIGGRSCLPGNAPYTGHKGNYLQGGIRVPLIFHWPAGIEGGRQLQQLASAMDILPTVIEAAGAKLPAGLDGQSLLPLLQGTSDAPVHDYLLWAGIHARAWGFLHRTATMPPLQARERAPAAWAVIKDDWLLRYVDDIPAGLYRDLPDGQPGTLSLYRYPDDPREEHDLTEGEAAVVEELRAIWEEEAINFPPPVRWGRDKWAGIVPAGNAYREEVDAE